MFPNWAQKRSENLLRWCQDRLKKVCKKRKETRKFCRSWKCWKNILTLLHELPPPPTAITTPIVHWRHPIACHSQREVGGGGEWGVERQVQKFDANFGPSGSSIWPSCKTKTNLLRVAIVVTSFKDAPVCKHLNSKLKLLL